MSEIIAGVYEIKEQIGAGGGGIVYLGRHIRLDKSIVLKADKRKLSTDKEALRREVELMKNFRHTYIPQIYDFVEENGTVYTVMDYIDGESLDKVLARNEPIEQRDVIKWAVQLLEALVYLHGRPPYGVLHADIKPANIMLRKNGDICLIDYNIALALGEEGAVTVGFSRGYASPEHYGSDYMIENKYAAVKQITDNDSSENAAGKKGCVSSDSDSSENADGEKARRHTKYKTEILETEEPETEILETEIPETEESETEISETEYDTDSTGTDILYGYRTQLMTQKKEEYLSADSLNQNANGSRKTGSAKNVMLDVRSDIYSLGATLYHLLSGRHPAHDAKKVKPLESNECSRAVAAIIQKAMAPEPDMRYQSAAEMLEAFKSLHKNDDRAVRLRKSMAMVYSLCTTVFLIGGITSFMGESQLKEQKNSLAMAGYSSDALARGDVSGAITYALSAIPDKKGFLNIPVMAQAQKALTDALGVYDLSDEYKDYDMYEMPSTVFDIILSPQGTRLAVISAYELAVFDMQTRQRTALLPMWESALSDALFTDENTIIYSGSNGICAYDLQSNRELWSGGNATALTLSGDMKTIAAINDKGDSVSLYDAMNGNKITDFGFGDKKRDIPFNDRFADAGDSIFELNKDGSLLAVSFDDGSLIVYRSANPLEYIVINEESGFCEYKGGFCGDYLAYTGKSANSDELNPYSFGIADMDSMTYKGGFESDTRILIQADERGIYLARGNVLAEINPVTYEQRELAYTFDADIANFAVNGKNSLVVADDNSVSFYDSAAALICKRDYAEGGTFADIKGKYAAVANRDSKAVRTLSLENHEEDTLMAYDTDIYHDEARISADGSRAVLFDYKRFSIYDVKGNMLVKTVEMPDSERIYDQQFIRDNERSWLEVTWYDGTVRRYDANDGRLISEDKTKAPDMDLYEEFYAGNYRIESKLHEAAKAYDIKSGKPVRTLESEAYLTYVSEYGDYIITEYVSESGERYGLLMNQRLETLAYLPRLCDITEEGLIYDYGAGGLRRSPLYGIDELVKMANEWKNEQ